MLWRKQSQRIKEWNSEWRLKLFLFLFFWTYCKYSRLAFSQRLFKRENQVICSVRNLKMLKAPQNSLFCGLFPVSIIVGIAMNLCFCQLTETATHKMASFRYPRHPLSGIQTTSTWKVSMYIAYICICMFHSGLLFLTFIVVVFFSCLFSVPCFCVVHHNYADIWIIP